jgi:hypothetical protein
MAMMHGVLRGRPDRDKREDGEAAPHLQIRVLEDGGHPWRIAYPPGSCLSGGEISRSAQRCAPQYLQWAASTSCPSAPHAGQAWRETARPALASSTDTMPVGTAMMP